MAPITLIHEMITAALNAADPAALVDEYLQQNALPNKQILLVSVGKAAVPMASAAVNSLGDQMIDGIVISKLGEEDAAVQALPPHLAYFQAGHPIPDARSITATEAVHQMLRKTTADQLILCCISGGTSALLTAPVLTLAQWGDLNRALIACGCPINDINHIRQHFDEVKGGGLAKWAAPAVCHTLILSDIIGNNMAHIGSGPTVHTPHNVTKAQEILRDYAVLSRLNRETANAVNQHLTILAKTNDSSLLQPNGHHHIIGDVRKSAEAAASIARKHGYQARIISTEVVGEAREVGMRLAQEAIALPAEHIRIYGGETTVTLPDKVEGIGGRNQEMALAAAIALDGHPNVVFATLATDGEDGANEGAGAIVTGKTVSEARQVGLDAHKVLDDHDSFTFFEQLGQNHLRIGSTHTNVNDLIIFATIPSGSRASFFGCYDNARYW